MNEKPILSIVTPTRGNFEDYWLERLLKVEGNVEFIIVYPPNVAIQAIDDPRIKVLVSPYRGEVIQRFTGLLNATAPYVLALDDDDFVHPHILQLTRDYFQKFPESWVLRLKIAHIDFRKEKRIQQIWVKNPEIGELEIGKKTPENPYPYQNGKFQGLVEVPIAPLDKKFDIRYAIWPRKERPDCYGIHFENFNNRVWKNEIVKEALADLSLSMQLLGRLTWLPLWNLDRLLGLFVQAKFFKPDSIIGHAMPEPEQIRMIARSEKLKEFRFYGYADFLLVKRFPEYGYLWNLVFWQLYKLPQILARVVKSKLAQQNDPETLKLKVESGKAKG
ncbi:MAG: glycosyltransferase family 2 protein [Oscillatoria sp. SIO1A7]|nr:glycosyltransferase family 2 protein [Oscillatoria sp. SIO1A7]